MASLQERSGSWRVIFRFRGLQHFVTIGEAAAFDKCMEAAYDKWRWLHKKLA